MKVKQSAESVIPLNWKDRLMNLSFEKEKSTRNSLSLPTLSYSKLVLKCTKIKANAGQSSRAAQPPLHTLPAPM